ncbi:hypothetical protein TRIUR3_06404 [Triticum urartu]|uniref:FAR1 domain-containing protein n=1 Tax=Triticum urartu TaxID=4572 RepID=M7ZQX0_TRIUA|nr:hypothetical protein TRIUR3_06404 [Triticum urartu]
MTTQQQRITGRHLTHRSRGVTMGPMVYPESYVRTGPEGEDTEQAELREQHRRPGCFLSRLAMLMLIPGATTGAAMDSGPRGSRAPDEMAVVVDRVSPLEAAIRGFAGRGTEVVVNPALGTIFDSLVEAYEFYNLYSWEVRFGIRYGKSRQNVNGTKCMQEIVCGCAGKPERENSCDM